MITQIQPQLAQLQLHIGHILALNAGIQGIVNFLGTLSTWFFILTFALIAPVLGKAGLQWAGGGGLLGDEHSIRGAVSSMKAMTVGALICGCAGTVALIISTLIGSITGGTPPPIPIPTPGTGGAIFPHAVATLHLVHHVALYLTSLIS